MLRLKVFAANKLQQSQILVSTYIFLREALISNTACDVVIKYIEHLSNAPSILIIITDITVDKSSDLIVNLFLLPLTSMS